MEQTIKQYKYRFVVFASYILVALANSIPSNAFSGINSIIEKTFQLSVVQVTLNTLFFTIAHTCFSFPCNWLLNKKGLRFSFYASAGLVVTGVWLRTFLQVGNPYICLFGSLLSGIGGIFVLNTPSRIAINWFSSKRVPFIISTGMLTNIVSMAISISVPPLFITQKSTPDEIISFFRMQAILVTIPFILFIIFFRQKPPHPPSIAAQAFHQVKTGNYLEIMKQLFTNREYVRLCAVMALNYGIGISFFSSLDQILVGIGYENSGKVVSMCASSATVFGITATFVYSYILKKTKQFKKVIISTTLGLFLGLIIWMVGLLEQVQVWWQLALLSALFGINYFSVPSIYLLFSTEIAFPVDQASAAGYLMAISQTVGFIGGIIYASVLNGSKSTSKTLFFVTIGALFISFILSLSIQEDLRKTRFEESKQDLLSTKDGKEGGESLLSDS